MSDWIFKKSLQVRNGVDSFVKGEEAPTAVEYGIMVALIAVAIIGIVGTMAGNLTSVFTAVSDELGTAAGSVGGT